MLFDSHIHLDFYGTHSVEGDASERQRVLREGVAAGITDFFVPACRQLQWDDLCELRLNSAQGVGIHLGVGQHPYWASEVSDLDVFAQSLRSAAIALGAVAIGECGIDKKRGGEMQHQIALFEVQLKVAQELELPCVVHCVGAQAELFASFQRVGMGAAGGVLHGFSGELSFAEALVRRGLFLGLGPGVTRTSRRRLREACAKIPDDFYVLETDAPDNRVDPAATKGAPADLVRVAQELAELRKQPIEQVFEQSAANARRLFRLKSN